MGITNFSIEKLDYCIDKFNPKSVGEYGSQQTYIAGERYGQFASWYYEEKGIEYTCFDLSKENNCLEFDLTYLLPSEFNSKYDLVTDFGCTEHYGRDGAHDVEGFYNSWANKHNILKNGGIMISENPKTGNWPDHGFQYYTTDFYLKLIECCGYTLIELGEHPAMGNDTDGWNVYCVLQKTDDREFISLDEFKTLDFRTS